MSLFRMPRSWVCTIRAVDNFDSSQVTAAEVFPPSLSIGIKGEKIVAIANFLPKGPDTQTIDAEGAYVTPGGIDSHVHLHQDNAPTGDRWLSGSRSALAGGNTTIIAFATQKRTDTSLIPALEEYHRRANQQCYIDYGFHFIITNPTPEILGTELPQIFDQGVTSVKLYMTYPDNKLTDRNMLDIMLTMRALGMTTMIHAENADMIELVTERLLENEKTLPKYHALARPQIAETEATNRAIALATLTSTPILMVHMSSPVALSCARKAQSKDLLPVHAETCPHYLYLLSSRIAATTHPPDHDHSEHDEWAGARHVCAPPLRHDDSDLQSVWDAINNGTITVVSSDHAPTRYDGPDGKRKPVVQAQSSGKTPTFAQIPNGLPGLETRMPLLFDAATNPSLPAGRKISLPKFVALTSTNAAKLYGLSGEKGSIAPGYDADICIWYPPDHPHAKTKITNKTLHHSIDYTPFEGFEVCNWPRKVLLRGKVVWDRDVEMEKGHGEGLLGGAGNGVFLKRGKGEVLVGRLGGNIEGGVHGMKEGERKEWGLNV